MKKLYKLGVIGCGFMATAILKGVILSDYVREKKIVVSDISDDALDAIEFLGVNTVADNKYVAENSEYLLIAVKPQNFEDVVKSLEGFCPEKVISIMAGITKRTIKNALGVSLIKVARCMPNLPCSIGSGAVGVDMSDFSKNPDDCDFIAKLLENLGETLSVDENKIDAVTGISGSGPAYVFMFIDSLIDAGVEQGLTRDEAKLLAVQTVLGAAEMVQREEQSLEQLMLSVCSKNGTTIEAVKIFEGENFRGTISKAVAACVKRSKELSK